MTVSALYIDPRGPYPALGVECWDRHRDATRYRGPGRIIAHPPCEHWGRYYHVAKKNTRHLALIAVNQVRQYGGVLEHPAYSRLWKAAGLPAPFSLFSDEHGGRTIAIYQGDYGHPAPKLTWLYYVGLTEPEWTTKVSGHQRGRVERQPSARRHLTPVELASHLVAWVAA